MPLFHNRPFSLSLTFGRQGGYHTITGRLQILTRAPRQIFGSRVCFPRGAQSDGERARQPANATRRQRWRASSSAHKFTSLRRQIVLRSATTISWFYELIDRQLALKPRQAQRRLVCATRQHHCALLTMSSSIFGAEQRISEPLSALAVLSGPLGA